MYDSIKVIIWGFAGKLKHNAHARKIIWLMLVVGFFSLCCVFFAAYVSFSRYRDLAGFLPGADIVGFSFTVSMAGFIFFASAYVTTFCAQWWLVKKSELSGGIAVALFLATVVVGYADYTMNIDGVEDVSNNAAGELIQPDIDGITAKYASDIKYNQDKLDNLLSGNLGGYGWRSEEGIYHLNNSGKKFQRDLSDKINNSIESKNKEISEERARVNKINASRNQRKAVTKTRLTTAVKTVYFIQFVLCLIMALLGVIASDGVNDNQSEETPTQGTQNSPGFTQGYQAVTAEESGKVGFMQGHELKKTDKVKPEIDYDKIAEKFRMEIMEVLRSNFRENATDTELYLKDHFTKESAEKGRRTKAKKSAKIREESRRLFSKGLSIKEISKTVGRSERTIRDYTKDLRNGV